MRSFLITVLSILIFAVAVSAAAFYWWWHAMTAEYTHHSEGNLVSIHKGMSNEQVMKVLVDQGIIQDPLPLKIYMKIAPTRVLFKAGDYRFTSPITAIGVLKKLEEGGAEHEKITVIEGWTRFDIAKAMVQFPSLGVRSEKEALALLDDTSLIKKLDPSAKNLEGYLFPDTYFVQADTSGKQLVAQMVDRFKEVWQRSMERDATQSGLSPHQIVTMASIVETEAKLSEERPIVASVIFNRLRRGMRLSVDSTIVYASKLAGKWRDDGKVYMSDIRRDSPYNTRKYVGLPPGPVGSPGLSSMKAVVSPANTQYLFYVRNPDRQDGAHNFYASVADFEKGVAKLRAWEKKQKSAGRH